MPKLPGADEAEKLDAILERAPPWLLWFTHSDVSASILGLKLPDLSSVNRFERGEWSLFEDTPFDSSDYAAVIESSPYAGATAGMPRALLKLAKRSLPKIILRGFELLVNN